MLTAGGTCINKPFGRGGNPRASTKRMMWSHAMVLCAWFREVRQEVGRVLELVPP